MTDEDQLWDQTNSLYDPKAWASPNLDFEDRGLPQGDAAVESGSTASSVTASRVTPPPFCPALEGRLFTAHDSIIEADCEVHPTARLLYDSLPQHYRDVFKNCPMYLEKHLEFVKYLRHLSLNDLDKKNEPSSEKNLIKTLGIPVSTEERDKKKWQCGVVGCVYRGTLQHLVSHLRTKSHIGIPTFACTLVCKILFHHSQDRDRHVKEKTCLKSGQVEDAEPQGSTRSVRGVRDQVPPATKPKIKSRANQHLEREREYQISAQTSAQGANDPRTRNNVHCDARFQAPGNHGHYNPGIPSASSAPPPPLLIPVHQTHAYHQALSDVPTTQDGRAGMHPAFHAPVTPDFFRTMAILPTNIGGMHANVITNNYNTTDNFQPTNNPQITPGSQPVNPGFSHSTSRTSAYPCFDSRVTTGYQDPRHSSTSYPANFAGEFRSDGPPQTSHRRPHDSRQPSPYVAQNQDHLVRRNEDGGLQYWEFPPPSRLPGPSTGRPH